MMMGIKEFRSKLSEIASGDEAVEVTNHGRVVGTFLPARKRASAAEVSAALARLDAWREARRAEGHDLEAMLASLGLDELGAPLSE